MEHSHCLSRRSLLGFLSATSAAAMVWPLTGAAQPGPVATRPIPSTGEALPLVGLGTWITFNVGHDTEARDSCAEVMRAFFEAGGRLIDSSPMYGSSQEVVGYGLQKLGPPSSLFSADKVWTRLVRRPKPDRAVAPPLGVPRFDLLQVHNLLSWEAHLRTLLAMKAAGEVRYVGITTSEGRRHREFERVMRQHPLDFIQVTYNILDREVEDRILPLAAERGIGVIVNRPFQQGLCLTRSERYPLPPWAAEIDAKSWAQFILKFIVSHPAVTCAIPATTRVDHVRENMAAATGPLPDAAMRRPHDRLCREPLRGNGVLRAIGFPAVFGPTYYRLFELYNRAIWPAQILALLLGLVILWRLHRGGARQGLVVAAILSRPAGSGRPGAIFWGTTTRSTGRRAYFAIGFVIEAVLLIWTGVVRQPAFVSAIQGLDQPDRNGAGSVRAGGAAIHRPACWSRLAAGRDLWCHARSHRACHTGHPPDRGQAAPVGAHDHSADLVRAQRSNALDHGLAGCLGHACGSPWCSWLGRLSSVVCARAGRDQALGRQLKSAFRA